MTKGFRRVSVISISQWIRLYSDTLRMKPFQKRTEMFCRASHRKTYDVNHNSHGGRDSREQDVIKSKPDLRDTNTPSQHCDICP